MSYSERIKNTLLGLGKVALAAIFLYWLFQKGFFDPKILIRLFEPNLLIVGLVGLILNFYFVTWRWQLLLKVQALSLSRWECFKLNLIGLFFNYVMPGGVGGDVIKAFYLVKEHPKNRMGAGVSVLIDRVMGLYAMLLLALGSMVVNQSMVSNNKMLLLLEKALVSLWVLFTFGLILAFSAKFRHWGWQNKLNNHSLGKKIVSAYEAIYSYSHDRMLLLWAVVLSLVSQIIATGVIWWVGEHLGFGDVPLGVYFSVVPLGFIVTAVPISPAGVGVGQMAYFFLFNLFLGRQSQVGPAVITAFQILNFILGLWGIWFFIQRKGEIKGANHVVGS